MNAIQAYNCTVADLQNSIQIAPKFSRVDVFRSPVESKFIRLAGSLLIVGNLRVDVIIFQIVVFWPLDSPNGQHQTYTINMYLQNVKVKKKTN